MSRKFEDECLPNEVEDTISNTPENAAVDRQSERHVNILELKLLSTSVLLELITRFGSPQRSIYLAAAALVSSTFSAEALAPLVKAANEAGCAIDEEMLHHEIPIAQAIIKSTVPRGR